MKVREAIKYGLEEKISSQENAHILDLKSQILREVREAHAPEKRNYFRSYFAPVFAFSVILLLVIGAFNLIQKKDIALVGPVTAQQVIEKVQKNLGERFYYKTRTVQYCTPADYESRFRNEAGEFEEDFQARKELKECNNNNGKLLTTSEVWADRKNNRVRMDKSIEDWQIFEGGQDKQGRERTSPIESTELKIEDRVYVFVAQWEKNKKGVREGVYVEKTEGDNNYGSINTYLTNFSKSGQEKISESLSKYKNSKDAKVELEEVEEEGKKYYKLKFYSKSADVKDPELHLIYEHIFDRDSYRPTKTIFYAFGAPKIWSETTYEGFTGNFDDRVFDHTMAPAGYMFVQGTISQFDLINNCYDCKYGDKLVYSIEPIRYKNSSGEEVDYPFNIYEGRILTNLNIKVYESKERFGTKEEADGAKDLTFYELKRNTKKLTQGIIPLRSGLEYESDTRIGEKNRFSIVKVIMIDPSHKKQIGEVSKVVELPYDSVKLPDIGNLKFRYIETGAIRGTYSSPNDMKSAFYRWKNRRDISINFYRIPSHIYLSAPCVGRSDSGISKSKCRGITDGEFVEERAQEEYEIPGKSPVTTWIVSNLFYKGLSGQMLITDIDQTCGYKMAEHTVCVDQLVSYKEKKGIIQEMKKALKLLEEKL